MLDIGKDLLNNIALNNDRASFKRLYLLYYSYQ